MAPVFSNSNGTLKKWLMAWGWTFLVVQTVGLAWLIMSHVDLSNPKWGFYVNAWCPLAWTRITAMLLVMWFLDWMSRGYTISTIMDVHAGSTPHDRRTAALFLLGIAALTVWGMKGQI